MHVIWIVKFSMSAPDTMMKNQAFSQAVITNGNGQTIYVGGQNAVDVNGEIVGKGDVSLQTGQVMKNLQAGIGSLRGNI
jgi:enamine deaminase RidA (YjgF/YER057c/UK114 family)